MKSRRKRRRNRKGTVATVLACVILLVILTVACLGVDIGHQVQVQTQLQAASDAGALAGVMELAKKTVNDNDRARAYQYALGVTTSNEADGHILSTSDPDSSVSIYVDTDNTPYTVTVLASRKVNFMFANLLQFRTGQNLAFRPDSFMCPDVYAASGEEPLNSGNWVGTRSVAAPYRISAVNPRQLYGLIPSIDHVPTSGPAEGQRIRDVLTTSQPFDLVWNPQKSKNVGWVKAWLKDNDTTVRIGETWRLQNGVVNSALNSIYPGQVIGIPVTQGGVPMNDDRQILSVITVEVLAVNGNSMTVRVHDPIHFNGIVGTPEVTTSNENMEFIDKWQPWTTRLID